MMVEDLKAKIEEEKNKGNRPFFVTAVCGSENFGAFDPISGIADVCDKHNLWLHVDVRFFLNICVVQIVFCYLEKFCFPSNSLFLRVLYFLMAHVYLEKINYM